MTPRILFVDQSGQLGGAELCLADVAAAFGSSGTTLLFGEGPFGDELRSRGLSVNIARSGSRIGGITKDAGPADALRRLPALAGLLGDLRRKIARCDIVYFNTAKAVVLGVIASAGLPARRIFHLHDILSREHFSAMNLRLLVAAANRCDAVIANSRATAAAFVAAGGRSPVTVIPNGFEPAALDAVTNAQIAEHREALGVGDRVVVSVFGRLARWKGQDVLLRAARDLPNVAVWIVGDALFTVDDRRFAAELAEMASATGSRVRLAGFQQNVALWMRASDVVVHCSTAPEPFGRVIVEAMFASRAIVAADAGGPREIIDRGVTGLLCAPGDADSLRDAVALLADNPGMREKFGTAARNTAQRKYSLPVVLEQTRSLVYSLHRRHA